MKQLRFMLPRGKSTTPISLNLPTTIKCGKQSHVDLITTDKICQKFKTHLRTKSGKLFSRNQRNADHSFVLA